MTSVAERPCSSAVHPSARSDTAQEPIAKAMLSIRRPFRRLATASARLPSGRRRRAPRVHYLLRLGRRAQKAEGMRVEIARGVMDRPVASDEGKRLPNRAVRQTLRCRTEED